MEGLVLRGRHGPVTIAHMYLCLSMYLGSHMSLHMFVCHLLIMATRLVQLPTYRQQLSPFGSVGRYLSQHFQDICTTVFIKLFPLHPIMPLRCTHMCLFLLPS